MTIECDENDDDVKRLRAIQDLPRVLTADLSYVCNDDELDRTGTTKTTKPTKPTKPNK